MINKIIHGLKNPKKSLEFAKRQIYLAKIRKKYQFKQKPQCLKIEIRPIKLPFAADKNAIIKDAEKILSGNLKIYSSLEIKTAKIINWHKDYLSGFIWPKNKFFTDIKYDYPLGTDIKNPWEISRFQQMPTIALAYKKTGEEKYAKYFVSQITNWIKENPVYYGINWLCPMEAAIRICNWLFAYDLLRSSKSLNKNADFYQFFCGSLYEHGKYIFHNLENLGVKSNHYFSDLVGLIWLGLLAPELPDSQKWLKFALKEFEKEIWHQFYEDGVNFEGSTSYHRLVLEMTAYTVLLCHNYKIKFSNNSYKRLEKAFEYTTYYLKPNGLAPQFGDNDSGRFLILSNYFNWRSLDHRYLLSIAKRIFPKNKLFQLKPKNYLKYFKNGQILIMKKWDWYLAINAQPIGQDGNGGHNHNDTGSFELNYKGKDFIIDPGTYVYTANPQKRNEFRSISHHSVFAIQNQEFSQFVTGNLFILKKSSKPQVTLLTKNQEIIFKIRYYNYQLCRIFKIRPKSIKIIDIANGLKEKNQYLIENLILDETIETKINKNQCLIVSSGNHSLSIKMAKPKIKKLAVSKSYGHKVRSKKITNQLKLDSRKYEIIIQKQPNN